ncbi:zonular occludens toxin domain-containing protein [Stenotrophomonas sp. HITSZ_GD]|uniref:zonular occludens toxin domain-containing protein n=1 Tax=Stenotrophomonas sp. HITSZ_GD TaxID=3037248 RepID=UPI00240E1195|nr:zonular occludens toxin domain-containing protein [Stenotrophomonas sp. HITSZ_GD]MDG2524219.1 zonular occludens toxin domain-containing protein [Stenotrophomonas sp. HITSZ_GD]
MIGDTAAISLLTGLPGAGKSLRMAEAISKLVEKGEHVFACNIDGLKIPGVTLWEDARQWRDLPAGAILFVDEAQAFFPERRGGEAPEYVRMNKIRHDGIRLVLATQQPNYLDTYLRGLVGYHEHLLRRAGKQESFLFRENQVMDVVRQKLATIKRNYDYEVYKFKPRYFACYDSAQTHQIKYQMPALVKKALMILPVAALLAGGAWYAVYRDTIFAKAAAPAQKTAPPAPSLAGAAASPGVVAAKVTTGEQYVAQLVPMVADVPWSAPAYVDRPVVSDPHVYCMATENSCRCVTEQNTRTVLRDDVCRDIARWGEPYNPYKAPHSPQQAQQALPADPTPQARADQPQQSGAATSTAVQKAARSQGTFPESPGYQTSTYTRPTTLEM